MIFYDPSIVLTSNHILPIKADIQNKYVLYNYIKEAKKYYPEFDAWYFLNVIQSLKNGTKKIITSCNENDLRGLAILKYSEQKICHLSTMPPYKNKGYGIKLFKQSFMELETEKPFLTVSEEKLVEFKRIFEYFRFELTDVIDGYYRKGKKEYFYNQI